MPDREIIELREQPPANGLVFVIDESVAKQSARLKGVLRQAAETSGTTPEAGKLDDRILVEVEVEQKS